MISSCDECGRILALWRVRCPDCKKSALNWLQLVVVAILIVPTLFIIEKLL
ncbi:MAG TPA: hypothetical protein VLL54_19800 [Pyrinomonadaceae bacterium]|nr:hypothetical protein [Pyrinomonadaceae bacterium]